MTDVAAPINALLEVVAAAVERAHRLREPLLVGVIKVKGGGEARRAQTRRNVIDGFQQFLEPSARLVVSPQGDTIVCIRRNTTATSIPSLEAVAHVVAGAAVGCRLAVGTATVALGDDAGTIVREAEERVMLVPAMAAEDVAFDEPAWSAALVLEARASAAA